VGEDDVSVKDILRRIDDLLSVLKIISEDLEEVSRALKAYSKTNIEENQFTPRSTGQPLKKRDIEEVRRDFPKDLLELLLFEVADDYIIIKPKRYLGSENFTRVASIVREQFGGEYISHKRESYFRIPR